MSDLKPTATPRILVVEDDTEMVELMQNMLSLVRCDVQIARSGEEALEVLHREAEEGREIDLVLLDIMVPGMDGYEVVARVKADPLLRNTAIIMTTALNSVSDKTLGLGLGADDYLTKPFDPQELLARIDAVMRVRRSEQAVRRRNRELSALIEITRLVSSSLDLDEVLEATVRGIREIFQVEAGSLVMLDEESGDLMLHKAFGPHLLALEGTFTGQAIQTGEQIVYQVIRSGEPQLLNDTNGLLNSLAASDESDQGATLVPRSILCVPIKVRDRTIGAIEIVNKIEGEFTHQDLELLQAMAASAAVAVDNANLYRELADFAAELERSQAQLIQAEKMAAIGRLAASVAHEINNPLQAIHNSLHLSLHDRLDTEKRTRYLTMAQSEVQRLIEIVQRMLDFYRTSRGGVRPTDVNELARNVLALAHKHLQHGHIRVHTQFTPNAPLAMVVPDQITQVFLNIVINAIEAMETGGDLYLETELSTDRRWVIVRFRDTGAGMSSEQLSNLFEPFYTTKSNGTGLGLAISYGIIERHGGEIEVQSRAGEGTTFIVKLPADQSVVQDRLTI